MAAPPAKIKRDSAKIRVCVLRALLNKMIHFFRKFRRKSGFIFVFYLFSQGTEVLCGNFRSDEASEPQKKGCLKSKDSPSVVIIAQNILVLDSEDLLYQY